MSSQNTGRAWGIDPHDWCVRVPEDWHLGRLHGRGGIPDVGKGGLWNENWRQFFIEHPQANLQTIEQQRDLMIQGFDLPTKFYRYGAWW